MAGVDEVVLTAKLHLLMMVLVFGGDPMEGVSHVMSVVPESVNMLAKVAVFVMVIRHLVVVDRCLPLVSLVRLHMGKVAILGRFEVKA